MERQSNTEQATAEVTAEVTAIDSQNQGEQKNQGEQEQKKGARSSEKGVSYKKKFKGIVVSTKPDKTVVVRVDRKKTHARYHKKIKWSKRYLVHDEENQLNLGDEIEFIESRPLSKRKCFNFVSLIKKN